MRVKSNSVRLFSKGASYFAAQRNIRSICGFLESKRKLFQDNRARFAPVQSGKIIIFIAGFQSRDTLSAWWSIPNGNTVIRSSLLYIIGIDLVFGTTYCHICYLTKFAHFHKSICIKLTTKRCPI